jgi:hypothetical protein
MDWAASSYHVSLDVRSLHTSTACSVLKDKAEDKAEISSLFLPPYFFVSIQ